MDSPLKKKEEYDYLIKLITIGDSSVGKSSIIIKYTANKFDTSMLATIGKLNFVYNSHLMCYIGVDLRMKSETINGKTYKL